jgi:hypothetical protein
MKSILQFATRSGRQLWLAFLGMALLGVNPAHAVPSFARQTGMACAACHTVFPELTPFGREFKLNGYVISNLKTVGDITLNRDDILELNEIPPVSVMFQASYTNVGKPIPDSGDPTHRAQNDQVLFPQQMSLFIAGKIAPEIGSFIQVTYDQASDHFTIDNADIRFADSLPMYDLVYGVTLNNSPTVTDPWNTTPVWGFPFSGPADGYPGPVAGTMIDGALGQAVGGATAYVWWRHAFYGEAGVYRSSPVAATSPLDSSSGGALDGVAPYWRFAYQHQWDRNSLEVGTYGMYVEQYPGGLVVDSGPTDKYTDVAADVQYQFIGDENIFSLLSTYIHEDQRLDSSFVNGFSTNNDNRLETFKITGNYYYKRRYGLSLGYVNTWGTKDAALYNTGDVFGSATGSPDTDYFVAQLSYLPWLNTKFVLQYTAYNNIGGASSNYDGTGDGRNASDNNTLYLEGWFNF